MRLKKLRHFGTLLHAPKKEAAGSAPAAFFVLALKFNAYCLSLSFNSDAIGVKVPKRPPISLFGPAH
jgi:hypothetical protein